MKCELEITDLKHRLDEIDNDVVNYSSNGFCSSRMRIYVGIWEKGEAVDSEFRGGKIRNYLEAKRKTGRDDKSLKQWHDTYKQYPEKEEYIEKVARPLAIEWTKKALQDKKVHVSHNSGENEWYTPPKIIESARKVLGDITLDPASSDKANETVKALKYYTAEENGLDKEWTGNIWLNPPYSQPLISEFSKKVVSSIDSFESAIVLVNNATDTQWMQNMLSRCNCVCFLNGRIKFIDKNGNPSGAPLQGQCLLYFGKDEDLFKNTFKEDGICMKIM